MAGRYYKPATYVEWWMEVVVLFLDLFGIKLKRSQYNQKHSYKKFTFLTDNLIEKLVSYFVPEISILGIHKIVYMRFQRFLENKV